MRGQVFVCGSVRSCWPGDVCPSIRFQGWEASVCLKLWLPWVTYSNGSKCRASYGLGESTQLLWEVLEEGSFTSWVSLPAVGCQWAAGWDMTYFCWGR